MAKYGKLLKANTRIYRFPHKEHWLTDRFMNQNKKANWVIIVIDAIILISIVIVVGLLSRSSGAVVIIP